MMSTMMNIALPSSSAISGKGKGRAGVPDDNCFIPWIEKYRPQTLDELVSQSHITSTISRFVEENRLPHLLLYGPPGTGKTSTILACAKSMYGREFRDMTLELNTSDDRGIDIVRNNIKEFARTKRIFSNGYKIIILDEADNMTNAAQMALRRVMEKYTKNCRFCLVCNYASKITPAIQSRCTRFRYSPLASEDMRRRLEFVCDQEGVQVTPAAMQAVIEESKGDMRRALNILQPAAASFKDRTLDVEHIYETTGGISPSLMDEIMSGLANQAAAFAGVCKKLKETVRDHGFSEMDLVTGIADRVDRTVDLPPGMKLLLFQKLADIESRIASGCTLQLPGVVAVFRLARQQFNPTEL